MLIGLRHAVTRQPFGQGGLQRGPGGMGGYQRRAPARTVDRRVVSRQAQPVEVDQVVLHPLRRGLLLRQGRLGIDLGQPLRCQLDQALRQHAQLAGAVVGLGPVQRLHHRARQIGEPQLGVHGRAARQGKGFVLVLALAGAGVSWLHQHTLGPLDPAPVVQQAALAGQLGGPVTPTACCTAGRTDRAS